jgi:D-arabinitol dehydrogenase (NADP+)
MKAVTIEEPGKISVRETEKPTAGQGEVVLRVKACGVCGTDSHIFKGEFLGSYPIVPGHEISGIIEEAGEGVGDFIIGERAALEPNISCGRCAMCQRNEQNFCLNWEAIGVTLPGGMAEFVKTPVSQLFRIGEMSFEIAAFVEPLSCVLHGIERVGIRAGDEVAILGAGAIGNLLMQAAKLSGASRVVMADIVEQRLQLAAAMGADEIANTSDGAEVLLKGKPEGFDVVIEATGSPAIAAKLPELARRGGRILLFGVCPDDATVTWSPFEIYRKGLSIHSTYTSVRNSIAAVRLLQEGAVRVEELVTHRFSLEAFDQAMETAGNPGESVKIQIVP